MAYPVDSVDFGHRFLALSESVLPLTASCFYRVDTDGHAWGHVLHDIPDRWLNAYSSDYWRDDPLHPMRVADPSAHVATLSAGDVRRDPGGARYFEGFLLPQATVHQVELYFRRNGRIVAGASLLRDALLGPLEGAERELLEKLVGFVDALMPNEPETGLDVPVAWGLTPRESDVARLAAQGLSNKALCRALGISLPTAKTHMSRILAKSRTGSRAALIATMAHLSR